MTIKQPSPSKGATVVIIMGVAGSGKTTVGELLAQRLGWYFADADDFHSCENKDKMAHGIALADDDRLPWLGSMKFKIEEWLSTGTHAVLACSALKDAYRDILIVDKTEVRIVYLKGSFELFHKRLEKRHHHYMKAEMLKSQFETLEEPRDAIVVDAKESPPEIVEEIIKRLG